MKLIDEPLPGIKVLKPFVFEDKRGNFVKPFHEGQLAEHGINLALREEFFSTSQKNVLRGMHFQVPPHAHQKLVHCITGAVLDVVLDLRRGSVTYGQSAVIEMSATNRYLVHIPVGFAHGFLSLEEDSCLVYKTDCVHQPDSEGGVLWDSFGFNWQVNVQDMILSERDAQFVALDDFESPF